MSALGQTEAVATLATRNLQQAASFYEGKLGLTVKSRGSDEEISYVAG